MAGHLEQSDGTAWMAMYCLGLLEMATTLAAHDHTYEDIATKFFEHFVLIASAMNDQGLWDDPDGFYYDCLHLADGSRQPVRARSMVGLIPLCAVAVLPAALLHRLPGFAQRLEWYTHNHQPAADIAGHIAATGGGEDHLLAVVNPERLRRILQRVLDEDEFLSPHGLRSLSRAHAAHPVALALGGRTYRVDYEPAESTTALFGGNSNWRGPVWFPLNYLILEGLRRFDRALGPGFTVECPTGSGQQRTWPGWPRSCAGAWWASSWRAPMVGGRSSGRPGSSRRTRAGTTRSPSTSTSTATPARGSAPPTRRGGPGWSSTSSATGPSRNGGREGRHPLARQQPRLRPWSPSGTPAPAAADRQRNPPSPAGPAVAQGAPGPAHPAARQRGSLCPPPNRAPRARPGRHTSQPRRQDRHPPV